MSLLRKIGVSREKWAIADGPVLSGLGAIALEAFALAADAKNRRLVSADLTL